MGRKERGRQERQASAQPEVIESAGFAGVSLGAYIGNAGKGQIGKVGFVSGNPETNFPLTTLSSQRLTKG